MSKEKKVLFLINFAGYVVDEAISFCSEFPKTSDFFVEKIYWEIANSRNARDIKLFENDFKNHGEKRKTFYWR